MTADRPACDELAQALWYAAVPSTLWVNASGEERARYRRMADGERDALRERLRQTHEQASEWENQLHEALVREDALRAGLRAIVTPILVLPGLRRYRRRKATRCCGTLTERAEAEGEAQA